MKKDIIFYSNHCTYCKEVINQISKTSALEVLNEPIDGQDDENLK